MSSFPSFHRTPLRDEGISFRGSPNGRLESRPVILASKLVKATCSIYMLKGRMGSTASKLLATRPKCLRIGRELEILEKRFQLK